MPTTATATATVTATPNSIVVSNVYTVLKDAFIQIEHAQHLNGRARTSYYKVATLLLASVVEALLHEIIKESLLKDPSLTSKRTSKKYIPLQQLNRSSHGSSKDLWLTERQFVEFALKKGVLLSEMNDFAKDAGLIHNSLHKQIVYVRDKRNELHIQGLASTSRSYTKLTTEKASSIIEKLFDIYAAV